jgi:hypothetical protein
MMDWTRVVPPVVVCVAFLLVGAAQAERKSAVAPERYGAPVTVKKAVPIAKLAKSPERFAGKTVRLEGRVKAVCQGRGCWVEVEAPGGASFVARSLDESVLLPKDCVGRPIAVQGAVEALPAAVAAEQPAEGHACPKPTYVVATQGVVLYAAAAKR